MKKNSLIFILVSLVILSCDHAVYFVDIVDSYKEISITDSDNNPYTLEIQFLPTSPSNTDVKWSSDNPSIASVDNKGNVTGLSVGETLIRCTPLDKKYEYDTCRIQIVK